MNNFKDFIRAKHADMFFDGISLIRAVLDDDVELELEDIIEQRKICEEFSQGRPYVLLAIPGKRTSATKEAREYSSQTDPVGRIAEALVIRSLPVRLMGSVYINFHKPSVRTKMFEHEEEAEKWLKEQLRTANV